MAAGEDGVETELTEALAPVLRDLESSGGPRPEVRDEKWSDFEGQLTAMLWRPHSGQGVSVMAGEPRAEQIAAVADQVQEWVVEALWQDGRPATWPECPEHPDSHPLAARWEDGQAVWACPRTGDQVSRIGDLPALRPQSSGGSQRKRRRRKRGLRA